MIKEVIIVEGKDDIARVKAALDADVIATSGFGFGKKFLATARKIEERRGVIILTDPDYMGNQIRKRLDGALKNPKHAFLEQSLATTAKGNIGVENAPPEAIRAAILAAKPMEEEPEEVFTMEEMMALGLAGRPGAEELRNAIAADLGIGHGNAKQFLQRLNRFGISPEELKKSWEVHRGR
ncbi:MAG: ribonuclease M5 [Tissierellia bacterium]|nr:ribonuclease M5 [Tissierellia bacterium]